MVESGLEPRIQALLSSLGSLRALYQQHPLKLSLVPPFPLLSPELNPQQISELNLERRLRLLVPGGLVGRGRVSCHHIPWRFSHQLPAGLAGSFGYGKGLGGRRSGTPIPIFRLPPTPAGSKGASEESRGLPGRQGSGRWLQNLPQATPRIRGCPVGQRVGSWVLLLPYPSSELTIQCYHPLW